VVLGDDLPEALTLERCDFQFERRRLAGAIRACKRSRTPRRAWDEKGEKGFQETKLGSEYEDVDDTWTYHHGSRSGWIVEKRWFCTQEGRRSVRGGQRWRGSWRWRPPVHHPGCRWRQRHHTTCQQGRTCSRVGRLRPRMPNESNETCTRPHGSAEDVPSTARGSYRSVWEYRKGKHQS
jgi:hypothetical protein